MTPPPRGFTLLLAVLISGILLALGFALYNIASKELILSSTGRDSQFAFYAADAGVECALYWDLKRNAFGTTAPLTTAVTCGAGTVPPGDGTAVITRTHDGVANTDTYSFSYSLGANAVDPCATVVLTRQYDPTRTTIRSDGFNTCVTTDPRRLQRSIRTTY